MSEETKNNNMKLILQELSKSKYKNKTVRRLVYKNMLILNAANSVTTEAVKKYLNAGKLFKNEYSRGCRRLRAYKRTLKDVKFLERHAYAPEMNKLHTNKGVFNTPQKTSIKEAIKYLVFSEVS